MICSVDDLPPALAASVTPGERDYIEGIRRGGALPFAVTPHFASLAGPGADDPIRRQFFPDPREALPDPFALDDPLGQAGHSPVAGLVHQYRDRALLLAAKTCAGYCRHCFRRVWLSSGTAGGGTGGTCHQPADLQPVLAYLAARPEITEILVSGGDPLTLDNDRLAAIFRRLRAARPGAALRLCTRLPVTEPSRFDAATAAMLADFRPLRISLHINHPRELSPECTAALALCTGLGIPVLVQTVLMRSINDDATLLADLFRRCIALGLSPYYLFQMDLAPGTAHFRVPLRRGLALHAELRKLLPAPAIPAYAVDLPGGGGKIRLGDGVIAGERVSAKGPELVLRDGAGRDWFYPAE